VTLAAPDFICVAKLAERLKPVSIYLSPPNCKKPLDYPTYCMSVLLPLACQLQML